MTAALPAGVSFNEMMQIAALRVDLSKKHLDKLTESVKGNVSANAKLESSVAGLARSYNMLFDISHALPGSIEYNTHTLKILEAELNKVTTDKARAELGEYIRRLKETIEVQKEAASDKGLPNSMKRLNYELQKLNEEYDKAATPKAKQEAWGKIQAKEREIELADLNKQAEKKKQQVEYEEELSKKRIDNELRSQQNLLNLKMDGYDKERQQAELDFKKTISDLDRQREEMIKKQNLLYGGIIVTKSGKEIRTKKYVPTLTGEDAEQDQKAREEAEKTLSNEIININKERSEEIKSIYIEMSDVFVSQMQRDVRAVENKYKSLQKSAVESGASYSLFLMLALAKAIELKSITQDVAFQMSEYFKKAFGDLSELSYSTLIALRDKTQAILSSAKKIEGTDLFEIKMPKFDESGKEVFDEQGKAVTETVHKTREQLDEFKNVLNGINDVVRNANPFEALRVSFNKLMDATRSKDRDNINKAIKEFGLSADATIESVGQLTTSLMDLFGVKGTESIAGIFQGLQSLNSGINQMFSGEDVIGGLTQVAQGLKQVINAIPDALDKMTEKISVMAELVNEQLKLIQKAQRAGGMGETMIKAIQEQKKLLEALEKAEEKAKKRKDSWIHFGRSYQEDKEAYDKIHNQYVQAQDDLEKLNQEYKDFLSGGITQTTIADSIAQGFAEGKDSAKDFAQYMNDILRQAVMNVFKMKILGPEIDKLQEYITNALGDQNLSEKEYKDIQDMYAKIYTGYEQVWDNLNKVIPEEVETRGRLSGIIQRSITEETGTELAGLMRKISDDNRQNRDYNKLGVDHLINIEANTFQTVEELKLAVVELKAISKNTAPVYSGLGG
jgi:DNA repair exonuclease SbcCD ATPase subunit